MEILACWDYNVLLWMQENLRTPAADAFWCFISFLGNGGWFGIAVAVILLFPKKTREAGITALVAMLFSFVLGEGIIKHIVMRPRPYVTHTDLVPLMAKLRSSSFPSGHTATTFAYAVVYVKMLPRKAGIPFLVLAAMTGFSRMFVGMHYPTDVIAGMLLGIASGFLAIWITGRAAARFRRNHAGEL